MCIGASNLLVNRARVVLIEPNWVLLLGASADAEESAVVCTAR